MHCIKRLINYTLILLKSTLDLLIRITLFLLLFFFRKFLYVKLKIIKYLIVNLELIFFYMHIDNVICFILKY